MPRRKAATRAARRPRAALCRTRARWPPTPLPPAWSDAAGAFARRVPARRRADARLAPRRGGRRAAQRGRRARPRAACDLRRRCARGGARAARGRASGRRPRPKAESAPDIDVEAARVYVFEHEKRARAASDAAAATPVAAPRPRARSTAARLHSDERSRDGCTRGTRWSNGPGEIGEDERVGEVGGQVGGGRAPGERRRRCAREVASREVQADRERDGAKGVDVAAAS